MKENCEIMVENVPAQTLPCQACPSEVFNIPSKHVKGKSDVRMFASQIELDKGSFLTSCSAVQQAKNSLEMMAKCLELNIPLEAFPQSSGRAKLCAFVISEGLISF